MKIGDREVGKGHPVWIVAELGGNHYRDYATAEKLVEAAAKAGADAVKTQCFAPDNMTLDSDAPPFRLTWAGKETTLYRLYQETRMPLDWHWHLFHLAKRLGLAYFASVFDTFAIKEMVDLGVPCLKIASFEITDLALVEAAMKTGLPVIVSTGMATADEIEKVGRLAWRTAPSDKHPPLVLLKCTSAYPAPASEARLDTLVDYFGHSSIPFGLSDHTRSDVVVTTAVALGACIVERHLTLDHRVGGPDAAFSDDPSQFAAMVMDIRETEAAIGEPIQDLIDGEYGGDKPYPGPTESERPMLRFRRSLWVVMDVTAGETFAADNVRSLRPADGLAPVHLPEVLGRRAKCDIARGTALQWEMLDESCAMAGAALLDSSI